MEVLKFDARELDVDIVSIATQDCKYTPTSLQYGLL